MTADCSASGTGQLVTKPINLQITNGEPQNLTVEFEMPVSKENERALCFAVTVVEV